MYTIRKKFKFEGAHILQESKSVECQNIHGHSYIIEVFFRSPELNHHEMVLDFKVIKSLVKSIIDKWDHKLLVPPKFGNLANIKVPGVIYVDFNPTAENMAKYLYQKIFILMARKRFREENGEDCVLTKVRVHETDTGYAEYSEEWK